MNNTWTTIYELVLLDSSQIYKSHLSRLVDCFLLDNLINRSKFSHPQQLNQFIWCSIDQSTVSGQLSLSADSRVLIPVSWSSQTIESADPARWFSQLIQPDDSVSWSSQTIQSADPVSLAIYIRQMLTQRLMPFRSHKMLKTEIKVAVMRGEGVRSGYFNSSHNTKHWKLTPISPPCAPWPYWKRWSRRSWRIFL